MSILKMFLIYLCSNLPFGQGLNTHVSSLVAFKSVERVTKIAVAGTDFAVQCPSCNNVSIQWTYKSRKGNYEDVAKGVGVIKSKIHGITELWSNVTRNNTDCIYNLYLIKLHVETAGLFSCWEGSVELRKTNLIVITSNITCESTPPPSDSEFIYIKQSDSVSIECSLEYSSDESCIATPIWTDITGHRNLTILDKDFEADMDDKLAWIHFKPGADIANGTHFNLSFAFNCSSFSNNSLDARQQGQYDFGRVPFIIYYEEIIIVNNSEVKTIKEESDKMLFNLALITGIPITSLTLIVVLLLVCLKKFSKLCFANRHQPERYEESALSKALPEIPTVDGYIEIRDDLLAKDDIITEGYEPLDIGTYETISDENITS